MTNGSVPLGTDITEVAAATAGFGQPITGEGAPFSGAEIRETFLTDGKSIGDTLLRSHFEGPIAHLRAMQIEQGMRVMRHMSRALASGTAGTRGREIPDKVKEYAELPASLGSAVINGLVSAAKDGGAREQALVAWGGGSMMARRNVGSKVFRPHDASGQNLR